ncbi:hypothetical protein bplSymb_SCF15101P003 [Bathymodiolus platifrons methanotrophic gill symbiont]|uniref:hypothetical protein n=1 Tax=Bathymodiolus platifrons methanotrophic gill symbiont TaxID=113268 RepID=UPI000B40CE5F|nr:hypothetical protein [Bathymodiolus platifrons methanotrophic gill symbiont]GAW87736.1 hypothetical protein bplSymb_SCF15101P003 [Bathymodiolus platifrons methanotrophic gill symbiont]GFO76489.1 hypothetical protein BPLS_P4300 [Bathymodiolus platifrons methanotrophic gill symbiont]
MIGFEHNHVELERVLSSAKDKKNRYTKGKLKWYIEEQLNLDGSYLVSDKERLTPLEIKKRQSTAGNTTNEKRRLGTLETLKATIDNLLVDNKKVTQKLVSCESGYSIVTVKRYWSDLKTHIKK